MHHLLARCGVASHSLRVPLRFTPSVPRACQAAAGLTVDSVRVLSDGEGYIDDQYILDKMPSSAKGFGHVRSCDGCRMKGISPDEISDYAAGTLDERFPGLEWVSKRNGAKKELAELQVGYPPWNPPP